MVIAASFKCNKQIILFFKKIVQNVINIYKMQHFLGRYI